MKRRRQNSDGKCEPADSEGHRTHQEYSVGYGKPPLETQYKPGVSGNPKGRPRPKKDLRDEVRRAFTDPITIKVGDRSSQVTRVAGIIRRLMDSALKGDNRAAFLALKLAAECGVLFEIVQPKLDIKRMSDAELEALAQRLEA